MNGKGLFDATAAVALIAALAPPSSAEQSRVQISYVNPERFADVQMGSFDTENSRNAILGQIRKYLEDNAARRFKEGETLSIAVTDFDMAGDFEPLRGPGWSSVRVVRDIYPPRIALRFRLADAKNTVLKEGERTLSDPMFLAKGHGDRSDPLRHEKALLDDWLRAEFPRP
jgi:hypothetical protein